MNFKLLLAIATFCLTNAGLAQTPDKYPSRPVTVIAPSGPGGGFDFVGRLLAQALTEQTKGSFVVENRTGSGTVVGTRAATSAAPDGHTLLVGGLSNMVFNAALYKSLPYDPQTDLEAVSLVARYPYVLIGRGDLKQNTLAELVAEARAKPDMLTIGTAGNGTGQHVLAAALAKATNIQVLLVPYKSAQAAHADLLGGRIDLFIDTLPSVRPHLDAKRAKAYFITSAVRNPVLADVPTAKEVGVPGLEMGSWFGLFAPAKTPKAVMATLRKGVDTAMAEPAMRTRLDAAGIEVMSMTPAQTDAFVKAEFTKWTGVIRQAGITLD
jgi:tripartite-type tricarboxylate transporter receptor subunit TctC